ncbi:MAG: right-handed parallel beta-helix repeat-containing protein, partial [Planctomycetota bacterium]
GNKNLDFEGRLITVRSAGGPENCVIDCQGSGRAFVLSNSETSEAVIQGFTITNGSAGVGGAMMLSPADASIVNCVFTNNTADIAGALRHDGLVQLVLSGCTFSGNTAVVGAGTVASFGPGSLRLVDCVFADNEAEGVGAVASEQLDTAFVNCVFARNRAGFVAGALGDASGTLRLINCVLSRNEADVAGGVDSVNDLSEVLNCTVAGNLGGGLRMRPSVVVKNSVLWGNSLWQLEFPGTVVSNSDVQGGWPWGAGNIDEDPLFVQVGTDNVRLSIGSPCVNAGDNAALPLDVFDLDGDGDTSEPLPVDLDGNPRVQAVVVDMGAYEGEFDAEAAAAGESDFDGGEFIVLVPTGGGLDPLESAAVLVVNTSGPDDATFVVTEYEGDIHPGAGGYSELSCILSLETSLEDGQFLATLFVPFPAGGLDPIDPVQVNLTRYDASAGNWSLAATGNVADSPGFDGPVGNRVVSLEGGAWGVTTEPGDYGVYWDPAAQQGFAWANVDVAQDFGLGVTFCPADCRQTPDGEVDIVDFLEMLITWGDAAGGGPCDIDFDGVIGMADFLAMLDDWGPCAPAAVAADERTIDRSPNIDGNAVVGRANLAALRASWGPCAGDCPEDLDGDGVVGVRDLLIVLAAWPRD